MTALMAMGLLVLAAVAWWLASRLRAAESQLLEIRRVRREVEELRRGLERDLGVTRAHVARLAGGETLDAAAVRRGQAWTDLQAAPALVLYERAPGLAVLDVRTAAEYARGHVPRAQLVPLDELEDRLGELPDRDRPLLVICAAGGRSLAACQMLAEHGFTNLLNLVGGMHGWQGPREEAAPPPVPAGVPEGTAIAHRGGGISPEQVVSAIRECFDPEIPLNVYDLGLVYGIEIDETEIAIRMTLTSEACPSARAIPEDVRRRVSALGQPNVTVDVVFDPPWHPSRISAEGKQKLGLA